MAEIKIDQLSPKSQKSRFATMIVGEANALTKKRPRDPITGLESHARDRVAFGQYNDRLRKESDVDLKTGLLSLRAITREIEKSISESQRRGNIIQIAFTDVREFKQINDAYGHRAGDYALSLIAQGLKGNIRGYDSVGRYGGDEDIVLLRDGDPHVANFLLTRLHQFLARENMPYNKMVIDMGFVEYDPTKEGLVPAEELIHRADQAMYYAKTHKLDKAAKWETHMAAIVVQK